jgi:elongation factor G
MGWRPAGRRHKCCRIPKTDVDDRIQPVDAPQQVIFVAIRPKTASDQEKLAQGLRKLVSEGSNFLFNSDVRTGQTVIGGMDELQLEMIVDRLQREFNVEATFAKPQVAYREALTKQAEGEGRYVRQVEGYYHYAHAKIRLLPAKAGTGYVFESQVGSDILPEEFVGSIDAGIKEALTRGVLAGYPIDDVRVELYDGSFHEVDSSGMAFKIAGSMRFQDAAKRAGPVVLEPIMAAEVVVPEEYMGDVIGDLNSRRGRIAGLELRGTTEIIKSRVPLSEMLGYATYLRSHTEGRASYSMHFDRYEPMPCGPQHEDDDRIAPVVVPRAPAPRGKSSGVSLPEPDND